MGATAERAVAARRGETRFEGDVGSLERRRAGGIDERTRGDANEAPEGELRARGDGVTAVLAGRQRRRTNREVR